jgi:hypothetical protein
MFEYLISPELNSGENPPMVLAITVTNDTISAYIRTPKPKTFLAKIKHKLGAEHENTLLLDKCISQFRQTADEPISFVYANHKNHAKVHTRDPGEKNIKHIHAKYETKITANQLKKFLANLKECEKTHSTFILNHKTRKDILKKYVDYIHISKIHLATNNPFYNHGFFPTIPQHAQCLEKRDLVCFPPGFSQPHSIVDLAQNIPEYHEHQDENQDQYLYSFQMLGLSLSITLFILFIYQAFFKANNAKINDNSKRLEPKFS